MRHVFLKQHALAVREASQSLLSDYAVLIAIHYSCISSQAELQGIENAKKTTLFDNVPRKVRQAISAISGDAASNAHAFGRYSCSGQVIATGKLVRSLRAGDYVACVNVDLEHHADIICVSERHTVRVSSSNHLRLASLIGPVTLAVQSVRESSLQLGESVCIVGLDLVGRLMVQLFKHAGCRVYSIDHTARLECTHATCPGADEAYTCLNDTTGRNILVNTHNHGVDAMVITSSVKHEETIKQLINLTRTKGKLIFVGYHQRLVLSHLIHDKGITCFMVNSYGPGSKDMRYEEQGVEYPYPYVRWTEQRNIQFSMQLIESGMLDCTQLIGPDIPITTLFSQTEPIHFTHQPCIIIQYQQDTAPSDKMTFTAPKVLPTSTTFMPLAHDHVRVGIVGVGNFAKTKLLPILAKTKGVKITALADANSTNSLNIAPLYDIEHIVISDEELFESDMVDAVVIASPHKFHCDQIIRAMKHGKAVFVEKPMVTDQQQLDRLTMFLSLHKHIPFCVDYSRSYAPFTRKIKNELNRRKTPVIIQYRVNAGFVPKEHWMQTEVGAGRIIGEACHIIDLFLFLVGRQPISVSVEALHSVSDTIFPTDNFSVHISFEDGSLCSVLYTALGHETMGYERMELFFDAKSIIMDDYEYLAGFGLSKLFDETATIPDRGHAALINHFFGSLLQKENQVSTSLDHMCTVASLTLLIDRLACEGGGTASLNTTKSTLHEQNTVL